SGTVIVVPACTGGPETRSAVSSRTRTSPPASDTGSLNTSSTSVGAVSTSSSLPGVTVNSWAWAAAVPAVQAIAAMARTTGTTTSASSGPRAAARTFSGSVGIAGLGGLGDLESRRGRLEVVTALALGRDLDPRRLPVLAGLDRREVQHLT